MAQSPKQPQPPGVRRRVRLGLGRLGVGRPGAGASREFEATAQDAGFSVTGSRPTSLWPDTVRPADVSSSSFSSTRFDPLAEETARLRAQAAAAFDVCHPALALRAVVGVQLAMAVVAVAGAGSAADWLARQAMLCFGGVLGTVLWLVVVCAVRKPLAQQTAWVRAGVVVALGAAAGLLAWAPLAWAGMAGTGTGLRFSAVGAGLAGLAMAAALWGWLDLRARIWHPANASARLAELQSRIRPHFLFNALNTALALVRVDPTRAEAVLEDLSQLFRVALAEPGASVSLEEELDLARRYLAIEEVRFGARLSVRWDVDPKVFPARVPPLVLQPLVENAVRHGIEPALQGGFVSLQAQRQLGQVTVLVSNSVGGGPGSPGHGMALHNVRERLRLLHDMGAQCDVWLEPAGLGTAAADVFHARLTLPAP
jgi:two-component system sensor histidine kinase AlgZ